MSTEKQPDIDLILKEKATAETHLENTKTKIRSRLKRGRKPEIEKELLDQIQTWVTEAIDTDTEPLNEELTGNRNYFVSVLPKYREEIKTLIFNAVSDMARELKRGNFDILHELNIDNMKYYIEVLATECINFLNTKGFDQKAIKKLLYTHTFTFIDSLLNDDSVIAKALNITEKEAREIFPRGMKVHFAVSNISNPIEALGRVKEHLDVTLSNENIAKELGITEEEAKEIFTRGMRVYFAVGNISNSIDGIKKWISGHITTPFKLSDGLKNK